MQASHRLIARPLARSRRLIRAGAFHKQPGRAAAPLFAALSLAIALFVMLVGCQAPAPQPSAPPSAVPPVAATASVPEPDYWPTSGWKTTAPEQQGMDSGKLVAMFDAIQARGLNMHSVLVIRNGYLVTEAYFSPYDQSVKQQVASVTKSVTGMLVGIAIKQGKIKDTGQPVLSYFPRTAPANPDANKRSMKVEHLLTQTTGLDCMDETGQLNGMFRSPNWMQYTLDLPVADAPGTTFRYCSPAVHLLSGVLEQATGKTERQFANETLFPPLGIPRADTPDWPDDPQGRTQGFGGLALTPLDMANLGFLYLHGGTWNGQEIVPAAWVKASLTPHTVEAKSGRPYGYLYWMYDKQGYYSAMGLGGQDIHIIPAKNMVVVFTAGMDIPKHDKEAIALLDEFIVPAATSNAPLPENRAGVTQLQARIDRAASPTLPIPPLPAIAKSISGNVYAMDSNGAGWHTVSLSFEEGSAEAVATVNGTKYLVGLDNVYRVTKGPGSTVTALRGRWEGDAFAVEQARPGDFLQYESRLTFPAGELRIEAEEVVNGFKEKITGHQTQ